ncbi:cilia- and flagella-associated protein HOATZ [Mycteria americana]|uniref:cilia- and flagella-associated protein HOATZ n=1 Tax=Mycteria americana TaxID=33587 RepID=UPI003F5822D1
MEGGHQDSAPCGATGTEPGQHPIEPNGPLVFAGSSSANVGFAHIFWTSAVLPPLLEPCLGPTTLRCEGTLRRKGPCPMDGGSRSTCSFASHLSYLESEKNSEKERLSEAQSMEKTKVKEKSLQQARRREEILAFLMKQREERIAKELISHLHKPKIKTDQER